MTYSTGSPVTASDYNTFATLVGGVNELYTDLNLGLSSTRASYGYGQTPPLIAVTPGTPITAVQWATLFQYMKDIGTHQGTVTVPPLPVTNPVVNSLITAYSSPTTLANLMNTLISNRFNLAVGQSTLVSGTSYVQPIAARPWSSSLVWTFQANLGSWNNARYFFNSGGKIAITGSYSPVVSSGDAQWESFFTNMSPLAFGATETKPAQGTGATGTGFYDLSTSYSIIYTKQPGGGGSYYGSTRLRVEAKHNASVGTNGIVDFRISLLDEDPSPSSKTSVTTYRVDNIRSTGAITYSGPGVIITPIGANSGFVAI